jgi:ABC-type phosphate transport system substrate-binding protein
MPVVALELPNTTVAIPSGNVSLRMVDNSTNKAPFLNAVFAAYRGKYPNVRITHDTLPAAEVAKVVPWGSRTGTRMTSSNSRR